MVRRGLGTGGFGGVFFEQGFRVDFQFRFNRGALHQLLQATKAILRVPLLRLECQCRLVGRLGCRPILGIERLVALAHAVLVLAVQAVQRFAVKGRCGLGFRTRQVDDAFIGFRDAVVGVGLIGQHQCRLLIVALGLGVILLVEAFVRTGDEPIVILLPAGHLAGLGFGRRRFCRCSICSGIVDHLLVCIVTEFGLDFSQQLDWLGIVRTEFGC